MSEQTKTSPCGQVFPDGFEMYSHAKKCYDCCEAMNKQFKAVIERGGSIRDAIHEISTDIKKTAAAPPERVISSDLEIQLYLHCAQCIEELKQQKIGVGWTALGLQVWCERHNSNIIHIDFAGQKMKANTTARRR